MIQTRPARPEDVAALHPEVSGVSYRAWVAELDGEAVGVIGLALTRPRACLFCGFREELRPHLKTVAVLRLLKKVLGVIEERGLPVFALRDRSEDKAPDILKRLGFAPLGEFGGDEVWEWQP